MGPIAFPYVLEREKKIFDPFRNQIPYLPDRRPVTILTELSRSLEIHCNDRPVTILTELSRSLEIHCNDRPVTILTELSHCND